MSEQHVPDDTMIPKDGLTSLIRTDLLSIFRSDEDIYGHDVFRMNQLFQHFMDTLNAQITMRNAGKELTITPELIGQISVFVGGMQKWDQASMLVADLDHLDPAIKKKLRDKTYKIAPSKKVDGNARAAIIDGDGQIKAQITLKEIQSDPALLMDVAMLSVQASLMKISEQLDNISRDVTYLIEFTRRQELQKPFLDARSKVIEAATCHIDAEIHQCIGDALGFLRSGLNSLYLDLETNIKKLADLYDNPFAKIEDIDVLLQYISEDMNLIPKYVALRVYLLNYLGRDQQINEVLAEYQYHINWLATASLGKKQLTAAQYIHKFFPYNKETKDMWLKEIPRMNKRLKSIQLNGLPETQQILRLEIQEAEQDGKG